MSMLTYHRDRQSLNIPGNNQSQNLCLVKVELSSGHSKLTIPLDINIYVKQGGGFLAS